MEREMIQLLRALVKTDIGRSLIQVLGRHFPDRTDTRSMVLWIGWCPGLSLHSLHSTFSSERDKNIVVKVLGRQQLNLSTFNELCGCCPWQLVPAVSFQHQYILCPSISLGIV